MYQPTTPFNGATVSGSPSATCSLTQDTPPSQEAIQHAITSASGFTGSPAEHSIANPWTLSFWRPKIIKLLPAVNSSGRLPNVPRNVYKLITRKGVLVLADHARVPLVVRTEVHVPAGSESADPDAIRAALSCHIGALSENSSDITEIVIDGIM